MGNVFYPPSQSNGARGYGEAHREKPSSAQRATYAHRRHRAKHCKMISRFVASLSILALAGCADVRPEGFTGPEGGQAYSMRCSGMGRDWDDCYRKAGELCPNGYDVIGQQSGAVGVPTSGGGTLIAPRQSLAVECK